MPRAARPSPKRKQQAAAVVRGLKAMYPESVCALHHRNPFELIVATILSAQCTDARVNIVTPALFARYPDAARLAKAKLADVEDLIHSTGFFRAKAKNLVAMATALVADHGGKVPEDLDALTKLPGVGRKTAHVVLGVGFQHPSGVVVDTHVKRLAFRLGLTKSADPKVIEHELAALLPRDEWINLSHRLIEHGRKVCIARRPKCEECGLNETCPKFGVAKALRKTPGTG
ncbi:MAG TPA: endonuclease III [Isosphaeraceae bacterium]